jgi:FixJ family two-component response regulator
MAVSAVKAGAHDFLEKPFSPDHLVETIKTATNKAHKRLAEDREP